MQIIRTVVWVLLIVALALFSFNNWKVLTSAAADEMSPPA